MRKFKKLLNYNVKRFLYVQKKKKKKSLLLLHFILSFKENR